MQNFGQYRNSEDGNEEGGAAQVSAAHGSMDKGHVGRRGMETSKSDRFSHAQEESQQNLMTQSELFKQYSEQNHLMLNLTNNMFWFEFGGNKIGRLYVEGPEQEEFPKWRLIAKYCGEFPCHFTTLYINGGGQGQNPLTVEQNPNIGSWFLIGGMGNNCLQYIDRNIIHRAPMILEKSFFSAVCVRASKIYTLGGYENIEKV